MENAGKIVEHTRPACNYPVAKNTAVEKARLLQDVRFLRRSLCETPNAMYKNSYHSLFLYFDYFSMHRNGQKYTMTVSSAEIVN